MRFPESERVLYERNPLTEVICQLRFSTILKIEAVSPYEFQESLREQYPIYRLREPNFNIPSDAPQEVRQLAAAAVSSALRQQVRPAHEFLSEDGSWKVVLVPDFVALTATRTASPTSGYRRWEEFSERLSAVMMALQVVYAPPFFTRVGLRYKDVIVRSQLGLERVPWREILQPPIAGELTDAVIDETAVSDIRRRIELKLEDGLRLTLQHGVVTTKVEGGPDEPSYLIDADFYLEGKTDGEQALRVLSRANREARNLFRWCITKGLHTALRPSVVRVDG